MDEEILDILQECGSMTARQLADLLDNPLVRHQDIEMTLRAMRKRGLTRMTESRTKRWAYDGDFVCKGCGKGLPEVKRGSGNSGFCGHCYHKHYLRGVPVQRTPQNLSSRLTADECGTWDGMLSAKFLQVKLR